MQIEGFHGRFEGVGHTFMRTVREEGKCLWLCFCVCVCFLSPLCNISQYRIYLFQKKKRKHTNKNKKVYLQYIKEQHYLHSDGVSLIHLCGLALWNHEDKLRNIGNTSSKKIHVFFYSGSFEFVFFLRDFAITKKTINEQQTWRSRNLVSIKTICRF